MNAWHIWDEKMLKLKRLFNRNLRFFYGEFSENKICWSLISFCQIKTYALIIQQKLFTKPTYSHPKISFIHIFNFRLRSDYRMHWNALFWATEMCGLCDIILLHHIFFHTMTDIRVKYCKPKHLFSPISHYIFLHGDGKYDGNQNRRTENMWQ